MTLLYNIFLCWKKDFYMGVAECVRSWLPCSKTWMSGVFPARAGRESESSPSKVTVCREIKVMYQGPFWGTNPVLSVWQGLWPLYCQGRGGKALPHQTRFCRDHSFVGGRKIGQSVVGKDMRWTFWEIGKPYNAHHFLFLFFVPHWWMPLAALFCQGQLSPCLGGLRRWETLLCDRRQRRDGQSVAGEGPIEVGSFCFERWPNADYEWT